jgi:tRNA dimethylallyltransferase
MQAMPTPPITLIGGPTASGKSALAMQLARETGAEIVGADSMQIYRDLAVLTAAPTAGERAEIRHHLVGVADAAETWSVGRWLAEAMLAIEAIRSGGRPVIIAGGTGLYFHALTRGLADIPQVDRTQSASLDEPTLRAALKSLDPMAEARIMPGDLQRLIRAHAVATQTGRSLTEWQDQTRPALAQGQWRGMVVEPDRATLYARCDARLAAMIEAGALDEVRALAARNLSRAAPALKAVGYRELLAHVRGEASLDEAVCAAQQETRRYAKRQLTWFRNQAADWERVCTVSARKPG